MCGIVGVCSEEGDAAGLAYAGVASLQHRGQESWGVAIAEGASIANWSAVGLAHRPVDGLVGRPAQLAIGHTRYSTTGAPGAENAQPLVARQGEHTVAIAHNGNVTNALELRRELAAGGYVFRSTSDSEIILALLATAEGAVVEALPELVARLEGAYSVVALVDGALLAFRDPKGFRPLVLGSADGRTVAGSETCALDVLRCADQREIEPGELVVAGPGAEPRSLRIGPPARRRSCVFEPIYIARRDSLIGGERVEALRERLGERLGHEAPAEADVVVPVPASGLPAARGYARTSELPLVDALVRNDYVGRTFIEPDPVLRSLSLRIKFNVVDGVEGLAVAVVDDSIVRGSTMRQVVELLRSAGAREVHVRIACPPLVSSCPYGVDIADTSELLASGRTLDGVRSEIGATTLVYLSLDGLHAALGAADGHGLCQACLTSRYPTPVPHRLDKLHLAVASGDA